MALDSFLDLPNVFALSLFVLGWLGYSFIVGRMSEGSLSRRMDRQRALWMDTLLKRELRMIDTSIMMGLQQGTGFFASTCIFVIGGCFALIGSAEQIAAVAADLPLFGVFDRALVEAKLLGLALIFAHAFFKFGWSYRLFNYCTILIGAIPMRTDAEREPAAAEAAVQRALTMNRIAARHFNGGFRAIFFGIAYLGWFLGPWVLMMTTLAVLYVLAHRQFWSDAHDALSFGENDR
ncbi:DUF599 domain-containing protein [Aureimonas mangrovi]|uniref:DUF599 domain-containing protein n=1 Tax=Aureimonas mangrovi TaxID=2758041 RepID=UPI00163D5CE6|nr:DUF599 family protein [Aureimonas mangrovi]